MGYVFADSACAGRGGSPLCWLKSAFGAPRPNATCRGSRLLSPRPGHWAIKGGDAQAGGLRVDKLRGARYEVRVASCESRVTYRVKFQVSAQAGTLRVYWDGKRAPGYAPMKKQVHVHKLRATSCKLQATRCKLHATSYTLQATRYKPRGTSHE